MITIQKIIGDSVFYVCTCGVEGKCIFKSFDEGGPSLLTIRCPGCNITKSISIGIIPKYEQEEDICYSLSVVLSNSILGKHLIGK